MTGRFLVISALALVACLPEADPFSIPISAARLENGTQTVVLTLTSGRTCTINAPQDVPDGAGWTGVAQGCPGISALELSLLDAIPESVILRMSDLNGPLGMEPVPGVVQADLWVAAQSGYWAHFTRRFQD